MASLTALTVLRLYANQIQDVTPLASLTVLTKLWINENQIEDKSPLVLSYLLVVGESQSHFSSSLLLLFFLNFFKQIHRGRWGQGVKGNQSRLGKEKGILMTVPFVEVREHSVLNPLPLNPLVI